MKVICTRPNCSHKINNFAELNEQLHLKTVQQKYCIHCGMPLILAGRYIPIKILGKGGFGTAFLAIDRYSPTLRKCVAKQFQPDDSLGEAELEIAQNLFDREALVLEKLGNQHPQIPDLFAYFPLIVTRNNQQPNEQYFYLVQEFIDGQDLEKELAQKGKLSEAEVTEILREVLQILDFVHQNNSIHRDIKPSNIIRNREGKLYLLDFGAVKLVTNSASNHQAESTGIYSMGFAPPEQMNGSQVFPATDLYALAVTCITLLTGKPSSELYDSYNNKWQWHQYAPNVSERLQLILDKMLLHSPAKRFQSVAEVFKYLKPSPSYSPSPSILSPTPTPAPTPTNTSIPVANPPDNSAVNNVNNDSSAPIQKAKNRRQPLTLPTMPILSGVAFLGVEATILAIVFLSALSSLSFSVLVGIWGGCVGLMIYGLGKRWLEKWDLLIVAMVSLGLIYFIPLLHSYILAEQLELIYVLILPIVVGAGLAVVASILLLILKILRK